MRFVIEKVRLWTICHRKNVVMNDRSERGCLRLLVHLCVIANEMKQSHLMRLLRCARNKASALGAS